MICKPAIRIGALVLALMAIGSLNAQDLQQARQLSAAHRYKEAESIYSRIIREQPTHLEAWLGTAHNYAWMGKHQEAGKAFHQILARDPTNLEALVGRSYNLAWAGAFEQAKTAFWELEQAYPGHIEVEKGLAYLNLWKGNNAVAADRFEHLTLRYPEEVSYRIALAQAYLADNHSANALKVIQAALQLDPHNMVAKGMLSDITLHPATLEADIFTGFSSVGGEQKFGLRSVSISGQISKKLRIFLRYDNSLSLDLASLVRSNQHIQLLSLGTIIDWKNNTLSRLEYALRLLPEKQNQHQVSTEQVFFLPSRWSVRAGGFYGLPNQQSPREWMAFSGLHVPIGRFFSTEPAFFASHVQGGAPGIEYRIFLNHQYRSTKGYELNAGLLYGKAPQPAEQLGKGNSFGGVLSTLLPFNRKLWAMAAVRYEKGVYDTLFSASIGMRRRFD